MYGHGISQSQWVTCRRRRDWQAQQVEKLWWGRPSFSSNDFLRSCSYNYFEQIRYSEKDSLCRDVVTFTFRQLYNNYYLQQKSDTY